MTLKHLSEYQDKDLCQNIIAKIKAINPKEIRLMEVCGTHTMSIARHGFRGLLPKSITLLSGPGCPVCVTSPGEIDRFICLSRIENIIITTFGDLLRVPSHESSLEKERAAGADIRMIYSVMDALEIAMKNPQKEIVFLGIGFETTTPTIAAAILDAHEKGIENFSVLASNKLVIPALQALMENKKVSVHGFICPGHVSVVIGGQAYVPLSKKYHIPCVVAGFEPLDILQAIYMLVKQIKQRRSDVEIAYRRGVTFEGNKKAMEIMGQVFEVCDAVWRGLGTIPGSGLKIRESFSAFDAEKRFRLKIKPLKEPEGCICGEVLMGIKIPKDCVLYGNLCIPDNPVGPCMVSSEGACSAYYKYL
jgi:hydrogenase expression/formation protein HypD